MKLFRPLDGLFVAVVALVAGWSFWSAGLGGGTRAVVYIANHKYGWYDIQAAPREVDLPTAIGTVRAQFGGGSARILNSPCPNKLCVKRGAIRHGHDELICLPARVRITIEGAAEGEKANGPSLLGGVDAVTR